MSKNGSRSGATARRRPSDDSNPQDDHSGEHSPSSSNSRSPNSKSTNRENSDSDQRPDSEDLDQLTVQLVTKLKKNIEKKSQKNYTINGSFIEKEVARIREQQSSRLPDEKDWEKNIRAAVQDCPDELLSTSRAYGDDLHQVTVILQSKMKDPPSTSTTNENEDPFKTSLGDSTDTLKILKKKLVESAPSDLFHAVLEMRDNEIDRADRMFYSEVRASIGDDTYTYENAHDQVQAIRLMQYKIRDSEQLRYFTTHCRNFDAAHAHLRQLARADVKRLEADATKPKDHYPRPLIRGGQAHRNDDTDENPSCLINSSTSGKHSLQDAYDHDRRTLSDEEDRRETANSRGNIRRTGAPHNDRDNNYQRREYP